MDRNQKFFLLTSLYLAQGLPHGFFMQSLPVLLRKQGMALETIGFSALLALPWALKFLWAPALDKWGSRRHWIVAANLLAVSVLLLLSAMPLEGLVKNGIAILFLSFFLLMLFASTQDIATDGLAVTLLSPSERGLGNGIQVAGYRVGMILSGGWLLAWFTVLGWQLSLWILAGMMLLATLPVLAFHEIDHHRQQEALRLGDFLDFFRRPQLGIWVLILLSYKFCDHFAGTMVRTLLIDRGMSIEEIAHILGTVGFSAGLVGALLGGWLVGYLGRFRALMAFGALQAGAVACWALIAAGTDNTSLVLVFSALENLAGGLATAALFTAMMDHCRQQCAGSDYTVQSCMVVMVSLFATGVSGWSVSVLGYQTHFQLAGLLGLLPLLLLLMYRDKLLTRAVGGELRAG